MSFNDLNETFNVDGEVVVPEVSTKPKKITSQVDDIKKDYDYTRGNLYLSLIHISEPTRPY